MSTIYKTLATKKATHLNINSYLSKSGPNAEYQLPAMLEQALTETPQQRQREQWLADNQAAIAAYNERVERDGVFSDGLRAF